MYQVSSLEAVDLCDHYLNHSVVRDANKSYKDGLVTLYFVGYMWVPSNNPSILENLCTSARCCSVIDIFLCSCFMTFEIHVGKNCCQVILCYGT